MFSGDGCICFNVLTPCGGDVSGKWKQPVSRELCDIGRESGVTGLRDSSESEMARAVQERGSSN